MSLVINMHPSYIIVDKHSVLDVMRHSGIWYPARRIADMMCGSNYEHNDSIRLRVEDILGELRTLGLIQTRFCNTHKEDTNTSYPTSMLRLNLLEAVEAWNRLPGDTTPDGLDDDIAKIIKRINTAEGT